MNVTELCVKMLMSNLSVRLVKKFALQTGHWD